MSFTAIAIGVGVAAVGAGVASAMQQDAPGAPDYAAANREGVMADIETLPIRRQIEAAARQGTVVEYRDPSTGQTRTADFRGLGDIDAARQQLEFSRESADVMARTQLDLQSRYGPEYIRQRLEELKLSDPIGFALREQMGQTVTNELAQGSKLSPEMAEQVRQSTRAAQAARGNVMGDANVAVEGMEVGNAGFRMLQQRLANASSFLSGTTPVAQFGQIAGAQQGAAAFNPVGAAPVGSTVNQNAGAAGANFAMQSYSQQSQNVFAANAQNPWSTFFGGVSGGGLQAAGGAAGRRWG